MSITQTIENFFSTSGFMPHGHCYLWQPPLVWTHFSSDLLIGVAYLGISWLLYRLVKKIRLPFTGMFLAFGAFIAFCGLTHLMAVWNLWNSEYWLSGLIKASTAIASVATWLFLFPVGPKIVATANAAKLSEKRRLELEQAHAELSVLYEKVKEADRVKTNFFANVSHELRTPLALLMGPAQRLIESSGLTPEQKSLVKVILRNSKALGGQVNNLLDISKIEAGSMKPSYSRFNLAGLLAAMAGNFQSSAEESGIELEVNLPNDLVVEADPQKIETVVINLLSNALKFTPRGGKVGLSLQESRGQALIMVEDTGKGVKPEHREAIFKRFEQGESGISRRFGGTGLGLAIARDLLTLHGGSIELLDKSAPGALFCASLPLKAPEGAEVAPFAAEGAGKSEPLGFETFEEGLDSEELEKDASTFLAERPSVLVCEDNKDLNRFIRSALGEAFNTFSAYDGVEGIEKAKNLIPDIILTDLMMPKAGGDEVLRQTRSNPNLSAIPVIILTAREDDSLRVRLLNSGASDYLVKPFDAAELKARLKNHLAIKKTRDILQESLNLQSEDLELLAQKLKEKEKESRTAKEAAEAARERAQELAMAKGTFLTLASHELKTPVTALLLSMDTLKESGLEKMSGGARKIFERALGSAKRLNELILGLLSYVELEGELAEKEWFSLGRAAREGAEEFREDAQEKGINLIVNGEEEISVYSDPKLVRTALAALISNALKFSSEGEVRVGWRAQNNGAVLTVTDQGEGIVLEDQKRIFKPFEQSEPLENKTKPGAGVGLAVVFEISKILEGQVELESEKGKGSEFRLRFPAGEQHGNRAEGRLQRG